MTFKCKCKANSYFKKKKRKTKTGNSHKKDHPKTPSWVKKYNFY